MRASVHDFVSGKNVLNNSSRFFVAFKMRLKGLVGYVENTTLIIAACFHMIKESRKHGLQKTHVFGICGIRVPAEDALVFSVYRSHNLWGVHGTPLSEQMADLKVFYTRAVANVDPTVEQGKVKAENSVLDGDSEQLCGKALLAGISVKRGCYKRCQEHIYTVGNGCFCEILNNLPMTLRPDLAAVIMRQGIAMEPIGADQGLRRNFGVDYLYFKCVLA